jgi:hypothetical protein
MNTKRKLSMRRGFIAAFIAVLLSAGALAAGAATSHNADTRGLVLFAGDSNITMSAGAINALTTWYEHNNNGYVPVFAPRVGAAIRTPDCLDAAGCTTFDYWKLKLATILPKLDADAIVTELGINDTAAQGTATTPGYASYGEKIDWFMRLVGDTPVFWTLLPCAIEPPAREVGCKRVNAALTQASGRWSNLSVLEWNVEADPHPEYMSPSGSGIHYSAIGRAAWARFVLEALDARFAAP